MATTNNSSQSLRDSMYDDSNHKCMDSSELHGTDSGFLSSGSIYNTESDMITSSADIGDSNEPSSDSKCQSQSQYSRLDSGVDIGLSGLNLDDGVDSKGASLPGLPDLPQWEEVYAPDEDGDTTLHLAILEKYTPGIPTLISLAPHPSVLDFQNDACLTPLHLAVLTRQPSVVRQLVLAGASVEMRDRNGNMPVHLASASGDSESVQALTRAVERTEVQGLQLSYQPFAQPLNRQLEAFNYEGHTPAHLAALSNNLDILRMLHWLGSDLSATELKAGRTPLHLATERGYGQVIEVLVKELGVDINAKTYSGKTAVDLALNKYPQIAEELVSLGGASTTVAMEEDESSDSDSEEEADEL